MNTIAYQSNGYTVVKYHNTEVVRFNSNEVIFNSGGWRTNTTKTRMNQACNQYGLKMGIVQKNFEWFVDIYDNDNNICDTIDFEDNMIIKR